MEDNFLYVSKKDCCGCRSCANICPKSAIAMETDESGAVYPKINAEICIHCGLCRKACGFQRYKETEESYQVYAAAAVDDRKIMESASGGVFRVLAETILESGGIVYGAAWTNENGQLKVRHMSVESLSELPELLGSKYVQSDISNCYRETKEHLQRGRSVLFSGTPCQIAGLKQFLGKKYDGLMTVDVICHGCPGSQFFGDYLVFLERKYHKKITAVSFRNKQKGWGMALNLQMYDSKTEKTFEKRIPCNVSSYYNLFLSGKSYRENCYSCVFADRKRCSDITLGDFWGIEKEYPELISGKNRIFDLKKGISCLLVNSSKGERFLEKSEGKLTLFPTTFEIVASHNQQLTKPAHYPKERDEYMQYYRQGGYEAVEYLFQKKHKNWKKVYYYVNEMFPKDFKAKVKMIISRRK